VLHQPRGIKPWPPVNRVESMGPVQHRRIATPALPGMAGPLAWALSRDNAVQAQAAVAPTAGGLHDAPAPAVAIRRVATRRCRRSRCGRDVRLLRRYLCRADGPGGRIAASESRAWPRNFLLV
jgi:hypothetical protein